MPAPVALVTGGSSGIGEATARRLHELGWTVYAAARRTDRMAGLAGLGIHALALDVTDEASTAAAVDQIIGEQGRIDVLINNAGYGSYGALEDVPLSEARYQFEVNVFGLARLTQLVLPHMRRQRRGRIINVSSIGGRIHEPLGDWYHATKFAVEGLSDSLRAELRPFGIDVVVIQPGAVRTEWGAIAAQNLRRMSASHGLPAAGGVRGGGARLHVRAIVTGVAARGHRQCDRPGGNRPAAPDPLPGRPGRTGHRLRPPAAARPCL